MKRLTLIILLLLPPSLFGQETTTAAATTTATTTDVKTPATAAVPLRSEEVRTQLETILGNSPYELATILVLDPTLLSDEGFLRRYPQLAAFVAEHPEVRYNPRYYLASYRVRSERKGQLDEFMEGMAICSVFLLIFLASTWLIRTVIDQVRWSRLANTRRDVHKAILDRFGTSAELLEYINTPAGAKFLESAPIPLHTEAAPQTAQVGRVLWSVQIGVIVAAVAVGLLFVSSRYADDTGQTLFAMGVIGLCVGAGFIGSALIALFLSKRLLENSDASA